MFHKIARAMNGRMDATARPDRGSGSAIGLHGVGLLSPDRKRRARKAQSAIASSALIKTITNDKGKTGTGNGLIVTGLEAVLLALFGSPPPETTALFVTVPGATLAPTVVVTVIAG